MYSNRRREHIHIIKQFSILKEEFTGTRVVIFRKDGCKFIKDYHNFIKHKYQNPKSKIHSKSLWKICNSKISGVVKKEMINTNEEGTLKMRHVLYESLVLTLPQYYRDIFNEENILLDSEIVQFIEDL